MSILVVSDSENLRGQIIDYLDTDEFGEKVPAESDGEARRKLGVREGEEPDTSWDAIIYDLKKTDESALKVCEDYASRPNVSVPIIAVVRRIDPTFLGKAFAAGVTDCIQTPLTDLVLRKRVKNYMKLV